MSDAGEFLAAKAQRTNEALEQCLLAISVGETGPTPPALLEAMRYSLLAGGKRLRPALALGAAELIAGDDTPAIPAACALEMIHTYSLIHDDLPAMDDDDLRRGRPTCHKQFGEATAILAGDALLTLAFQIIAETDDAGLVQEVAAAAGVTGMAGGQLLDLEAEGKPITLDELRRIHALKTGALIRTAVRAGARLANARSDQLDALTTYGDALGLAFQIADDILDVTGTEADLGKRVGSDVGRSKATYPAIVGIEEAKRLADESCAQAVEALSQFGVEADALRALARFVVERKG